MPVGRWGFDRPTGARQGGAVSVGDEIEFGLLRHDELPLLEQWTSVEGWNPGTGDLQVAWDVDPDAFVAMRSSGPDGELLGTGTTFVQAPSFGFMGLFVVRPDARGHGLGARLWIHRRDRMVGRLAPGATVGIDGVFDMVPFYERGGFSFAHRTLRFQGPANGVDAPDIEVHQPPLDAQLLGEIVDVDARHQPVRRERFLEGWLRRPGVVTAIRRDASGRLCGLGVLRPCADGYKIGPLDAADPATAAALLATLTSDRAGPGVVGQQVQIDVPEPNEAASDLVASLGWNESFGCARMYLGPDPGLPLGSIFGVTSFEFG